jgi:hypothetical protein
MATIVHEGVGQERRLFQRRLRDRSAVAPDVVVRDDVDGMRVSWGGIWGGVLVAMGILILLTALGVAVGISAVDPNAPDGEAIGVGAAVWAAVSLLLALYVGGMASTRIGAVFDKTTGMFEGALVWVLSLLVMGYLAGSGVGMVANGAFKLVGGATQALGSMVTGAAPDLTSGNVDQMLQKLKDPQTARTLASATGMPENEVQSNLSQIADRAQAAKDNPAQAATEVRQGVQGMMERARSEGRLSQAAEKAKSAGTKTAWITFGAMILSLIAAVLGAMSGRRVAAVHAGREART